MKAEIITIDSHLLRGQTTDKAVAFLTRELIAMGIPTHQSVQLGNHSEDLKNALKMAGRQSDLIIIIGDLGPLGDDTLKTVIFEHLNIPLVSNSETVSIEGFLHKYLEKTYILLPKSFNKLKHMFLENTRPLIIENLLENAVIETQIYSVYGLTLTHANEKLSDLIAYDKNPFVGIYSKNDIVEIQITAKAESEKEAMALINDVAIQVRDRVGEYIFSENEEQLVQVVKRLLKEQGKKITAAESLTGGSFLDTISGEPGSSEIFDGGIVAYSEDIKNNVLEVTTKTLTNHGMVSPQCAIEMAEKSMEMFKADISVSLTGAAGPSALEGERPGTVWIGLAQTGRETFAKKFNFEYTREENRRNSVLSALNLARLALLDEPIENQVFFNVEENK